MDTLTDLFALAQQWLFETVVQPLALLAGQANILEKAYEGTGWLLVGLIQITLMLVLIGPMQRLWPAEVQHDRGLLRVVPKRVALLVEVERRPLELREVVARPRAGRRPG